MSLYREIRMKIRDTLMPSLVSEMRSMELKEVKLHWRDNQMEGLTYAVTMFPNCERLKQMVCNNEIRIPHECRFVIKNDGSIYLRSYVRANENNMMISPQEYSETVLANHKTITEEGDISNDAVCEIASMLIRALRKLESESREIKGFIAEMDDISKNPRRNVLTEKTIMK